MSTLRTVEPECFLCLYRNHEGIFCRSVTISDNETRVEGIFNRGARVDEVRLHNGVVLKVYMEDISFINIFTFLEYTERWKEEEGRRQSKEKAYVVEEELNLVTNVCYDRRGSEDDATVANVDIDQLGLAADGN